MKNRFYILCARLILLSLVACIQGCSESRRSITKPSSRATVKGSTLAHSRPVVNCPETANHRGAFPFIQPEHQTPEFWLSRWKTSELDKPLLTTRDIASQNAAVGQSGILPASQWNLLEPINPERQEVEIHTRLQAISSLVEQNLLVTHTGKPMPPPQRKNLQRDAGILSSEEQARIWYVAINPIQMRCVPFDAPLYNADSDMTYDKNACSTIGAQEPFEVLGQWKNDMLFVRTPYAFGFVSRNVPHSPNIPDKYRDAYINAPKMWLTSESNVACDDTVVALQPRIYVPTLPNQEILVARSDSFCASAIPKDAIHTRRALTRRTFIDTAFQYLGHPYGYGGSGNGLDCSRFVMDVMGTFHIVLPRNSKQQSVAGVFSVDVSKVKDLSQKQHYLDLANQSGIVALYFPGHIMFYLGRSESGVPMAIHALGEYARPCDTTDSRRGETVFRVKKVVVTDLSLGLGSSRRSFLERTTNLVIFGSSPATELQPVLNHRAAKRPVMPTDKCTDSIEQRIFQSPRRLITNEPARLIATGSQNPGPSTLQIFGPLGRPLSHTVHQLGGPPYTVWTQFVPLEVGTYTAVLGDGETIFACDEFTVRPWRSKKKAREEPGPYWENRWKWEPDTENFFSAFVEQLFDLPVESDITWHGLQEVLKDANRNLLYNHLGQDEDDELQLTPDCADLPYFLRAYFSWKTGLPFGVRSCSRGRKGRPPSCSEFQTNLIEAPFEEELDSEAKIFERFANVVIGWNAHSASGRTHPASDESDFYPVNLSRQSLPPGTIFADPYGHIMILSKWVPQPAGGHGILMAVDGQPDGTIGRRRFWRGDFLFDADTESYGAGFKRFRPIEIVDEITDTGTVKVPETMDNRSLRKSRIFSRYSLSQYENGIDAFYAKMQQLINPMPLNAEELLQSQIDALHEAVKRRGQAIENGEAFMAENDFNPIEMPEGQAIFQTEGPWEDYSTPSRDMRLLIALDAVLMTPNHVAKNPKQYGISDSFEINRVIDNLTRIMEAELDNRKFQYTRSDASRWRLSLSDVAQRQKALEMAYNPNDCPEIRWGAKEKSDESSTCKRHAPDEQHARMQAYRPWFRQRKRPVRD
ncbi:MAG: C40 family peptidase [Deltaproteobacteria bacterium]|nr:C40 family peptidase [Deltaproteobacteria bacterium]